MGTRKRKAGTLCYRREELRMEEDKEEKEEEKEKKRKKRTLH